MSDLKPEVVKAIRDSIKHWEEDMLKPLKAGKTIVLAWCGGRPYRLKPHWACKDDKLSMELVKCYGEDCALCHIYQTDYCMDCPLGNCGSGSPYSRFRLNPCIDTAEAMIKALEDLL
jgi:hypothetical protein